MRQQQGTKAAEEEQRGASETGLAMAALLGVSAHPWNLPAVGISSTGAPECNSFQIPLGLLVHRLALS